MAHLLGKIMGYRQPEQYLSRIHEAQLTADDQIKAIDANGGCKSVAETKIELCLSEQKKLFARINTASQLEQAAQ